MAVRTFVTSGVAFVAAGAVAATVALAPPMSPRDIQVAKSTEVSLNALVTDPFLVEAINNYFNSGAAAVVQQLLIAAVGEEGSPADVINTFFNENNPLAPDTDGVSENPALFGASGLVYLSLVAAGVIPQVPLVNEFFQGGASLVTQALLLALAPGQADLINDFFTGGVDQVVQTRLSALLAGTPQAQQLVNDFFNGGTPLVTFRALGGDTGNPEDPDDLTSSPYLSAFFGINNNILNPDGNDSPGLFGASGVLLQGLHDGGVNSPEVDDFFNGGVPLVVQNQLLALAPDNTTQSLINGFFSIGISDVIRQILVGPDAPPPVTPPPGDDLRTINVAAVQEDPDVKSAGTDLKDLKPVVEKTKAKVATDPVQAVQAASAPAASPAAAPAPVVVKDKAPVVVKASDDDKTKDSNDVTEAMKNGNKVDVDPILLLGANGGGPKPGEGSWGVFGQVANAISKAVTGAGAGSGAPKNTPSNTEGAGTGSK